MRVFHDRDEDGVWQPEAEELLAGAQLWVETLDNQALLTGTTASNVEPYCFDALLPEPYQVRKESPPGYQATTAEVVTATVLSDLTVFVHFGDVRLPSNAIALPLIMRQFEKSGETLP